MEINFNLNEENVTINTNPETRLIDVLRNNFNLTGTKEGCGEGECGSCMVLINDLAINSCLTPIASVIGKNILTIEGFSKTEQFEIISEELKKAGAVQCGFCTPGIVISSAALLKSNPNPDKEQIREGLSGNICRCTGYISIVDGIKNAAKKGKVKW